MALLARSSASKDAELPVLAVLSPGSAHTATDRRPPMP
jgi:hypothetical protein